MLKKPSYQAGIEDIATSAAIAIQNTVRQDIHIPRTIRIHIGIEIAPGGRSRKVSAEFLETRRVRTELAMRVND